MAKRSNKKNMQAKQQLKRRINEADHRLTGDGLSGAALEKKRKYEQFENELLVAADQQQQVFEHGEMFAAVEQQTAEDEEELEAEIYEQESRFQELLEAELAAEEDDDALQAMISTRVPATNDAPQQLDAVYNGPLTSIVELLCNLMETSSTGAVSVNEIVRRSATFVQKLRVEGTFVADIFLRLESPDAISQALKAIQSTSGLFHEDGHNLWSVGQNSISLSTANMNRLAATPAFWIAAPGSEDLLIIESRWSRDSSAAGQGVDGVLEKWKSNFRPATTYREIPYLQGQNPRIYILPQMHAIAQEGGTPWVDVGVVAGSTDNYWSKASHRLTALNSAKNKALGPCRIAHSALYRLDVMAATAGQRKTVRFLTVGLDGGSLHANFHAWLRQTFPHLDFYQTFIVQPPSDAQPKFWYDMFQTIDGWSWGHFLCASLAKVQHSLPLDVRHERLLALQSLLFHWKYCAYVKDAGLDSQDLKAKQRVGQYGLIERNTLLNS